MVCRCEGETRSQRAIEYIEYIEYIETHGEALFREMASHDQEGIVAKRIDAAYRAGRQSRWVKIKNQEYSRRGAVGWRRLVPS